MTICTHQSENCAQEALGPSNVTMIQNTSPNQPFTGQRRRRKNVKVLEWARQSSDLNIIELLRGNIRCALHARLPKNFQDPMALFFIIQEEWTTLPSRKIKVLITEAKGRNH